MQEFSVSELTLKGPDDDDDKHGAKRQGDERQVFRD
jgi:hypothetical protein